MSALIQLPKMGLLQEACARQVQMMSIVFAILSEVVKQAGVPGPILDVVPDQDITTMVQVRDGTVTVSIKGEPGKDSAYVAVN